MIKVKAGDTVVVRQWGGGTLTGTVEEVLEDVKHGLPGIDYEVHNPQGEWERHKWAYMDQIISVS